MNKKSALTTLGVTIIASLSILAPAFSAPRTTPTTIDPSGNTVKVDSTANTVKIDSTVNTVKLDNSAYTLLSPTKHNTVQLWATDQVIANNGYSPVVQINCAGYKELRVVIGTASLASMPNLTVYVLAWTPSGGYTGIATANFGMPSGTAVGQGNLTPIGGRLAFTVPVMCDTMGFLVQNTTGSSQTIWNWSWAYLVN